MAETNILDQSIDEFIASTGLGSRERSLTNMLYGTNHAHTHPGLPYNKNTYGWTFFTRPQLNLRTVNVRRERSMYPLLSKEALSIQRYVRTMLDPRLQHSIFVNNKLSSRLEADKLVSPLVDKKNPFIPILTNSIINISGWPDEVVPTYTSSAGNRREQTAMVDGIYEINEVFDLNVTFTNYENDPLLLLFQTWMRYSSLVFEGRMSPYMDMIVENEIDYNTRIYRLTTDSSWRYLSYIAATGASFPVSTPIGKMFDYSKDKPYIEQTKEINISMKSIGVNYNDDITIYEFNKVHGIFNVEYRSYLEGNLQAMAKIPLELKPLLNFRGYPYVNPKTYEIEWLVGKDSKLYKQLTSKYDIIKDSEIIKLTEGIV